MRPVDDPRKLIEEARRRCRDGGCTNDRCFFRLMADALDAALQDNERLNQMIRDTGQGQGAIDAYVDQCDEIAALRQRAEAAERERNAAMPPCVQFVSLLSGHKSHTDGKDGGTP